MADLVERTSAEIATSIVDQLWLSTHEKAKARKLFAAALEAEASEGERLRAALVVAKRSILEDTTGAVVCTVWVPNDVSFAETLVDHIDAALIPEAPVREAE